MCVYSDQGMHVMAEMTARAADTGSETGVRDIPKPTPYGVETQRNTND